MLEELGSMFGRTKKPDPLDEPFALWKKVLMVTVSLVFPWLIFLPNMMIIGYRRTHPFFPHMTGYILSTFVFSISYTGCIFLLLDRPRVVRLRMRKGQLHGGEKKDEPFREKVAQFLYMVAFTLQVMVSADDAAVQRFYPLVLRMVGSLLTAVAFPLNAYVLRHNQFASTVIFQQEDQYIVKSGPYQYVRHPLYSFHIVYCTGFPLMIGTYIGLIPSMCVVLVSMWRTYHEEEFLVKNFGYKYEQYRKEVPYKMFPGIF